MNTQERIKALETKLDDIIARVEALETNDVHIVQKLDGIDKIQEHIVWNDEVMNLSGLRNRDWPF
jgi:hypothetical protein